MLGLGRSLSVTRSTCPTSCCSLRIISTTRRAASIVDSSSTNCTPASARTAAISSIELTPSLNLGFQMPGAMTSWHETRVRQV